MRRIAEDGSPANSQVSNFSLAANSFIFPLSSRSSPTSSNFKRQCAKQEHRPREGHRIWRYIIIMVCHILSGDTSLLEMSPLFLCIETTGSGMSPLFGRNTTILTRKSAVFVFSTYADNLPGVVLFTSSATSVPCVPLTIATGESLLDEGVKPDESQVEIKKE